MHRRVVDLPKQLPEAIQSQVGEIGETTVFLRLAILAHRNLGWRVVLVWECQATDGTALTQWFAVRLRVGERSSTQVATE